MIEYPARFLASLTRIIREDQPLDISWWWDPMWAVSPAEIEP